MAHEPSHEDDVDRLHGDGHIAGDGQSAGCAEEVGDQRHGRKKQGHSGRLVEDEVAVGQHPVGQAQGGPEPHAIVVLQDVVGTSRPEQLEDTQTDGDQGQDGDDPASPRHHPAGPVAALAAASDQACGAILHEMGTLPRPRAAAGEASA